MQSDLLKEKLLEEINDDHFSSALDTPLRKDAFDLSDNQKIKIIADHFQKIGRFGYSQILQLACHLSKIRH